MNKITAIVLAAGSGSRMKSKNKKTIYGNKGKAGYLVFPF